MTDQISDRDPFEMLADEYTARLRRGEHPSLEDYVTSHPEWAGEIRDLFPTIAEMEGMKRRKERSAPRPAFPDGFRVGRLGDFRILEEIGRGGMGIVYKAEQESLGRHVAIKVLPRSLLPGTKEYLRFEREARTAGKLHHTNIVPVFGVGHQDGYHYYVMQYIPGVGLDEVLREIRKVRASGGPEAEEDGTGAEDPIRRRAGETARIAQALLSGQFRDPGNRDDPEADLDHQSPTVDSEPTPGPSKEETEEIPREEIGMAITEGRRTGSAAEAEASWPTPAPLDPGYWRCVAGIGSQVASALHYAHSQGTLHRDIKPGNLILDAQGFVWVADFGLAKPMEDDSISQTGDVVGTLRYMAPEQLSGQADARSDVYGLGLTLYELIALRPAYPDRDTKKLIQAISEGQPLRPRKLRPEIPRDLETIVLKAIAREPAHRYQSAGDLAADIQRFLDDVPIAARRTGAAGRLWRWSRRNRALASLSGAALALLILLAVTATIGYLQTRKAMEGESRSSQLALGALDKIFGQFASNRFAPTSSLTYGESEGESGTESGTESGSIEVPIQPVLSRSAAVLLEHLLEFYNRLAEQGGDDAKLRRKVAEANRRVGDIRARLGNYEDAKAAYERALAVYGALQEKSLGDEALCIDTAKVYNELGSLSAEMQEPGQAFHQKAIAILTPLSSTPSALSRSPEFRYELARTCYFLGKGWGPGSSPPGPSPGFPMGPEGRKNRRTPDPGARAPGNPPDPDRPPGARRPERESEPHPEKPDAKRGPSPGRRGPPDGNRFGKEQEESLKKAIVILEGLLAENPRPEYHQLLARCYQEKAKRPPAPGEPPGFGSLDKATAILQKLVDDFPNVPDYQYDLSKMLADAGGPFLRWRGPGTGEESAKKALESLQKALGISEALVADYPQVPNYAVSLVEIRISLAGGLQAPDRLEDAEVHLRKALALQAALVRRYPEVPSYKFLNAAVQGFLAGLLQKREQFQEARSIIEESISMLEALLKDHQATPQLGWVRFMLSGHWSALARVLSDLGEGDLSAKAWQKAEALGPGPGPPRERPGGSPEGPKK